MESFDISKASRDELQRILSSAKNEWEKYTNCGVAIERCKNRFGEEKKKDGEERERRSKILSFTMAIILFSVVGAIFCGNEFFRDYTKAINDGLGVAVVIGGAFVGILLTLLLSSNPELEKKLITM